MGSRPAPDPAGIGPGKGAATAGEEAAAVPGGPGVAAGSHAEAAAAPEEEVGVEG